MEVPGRRTGLWVGLGLGALVFVAVTAALIAFLVARPAAPEIRASVVQTDEGEALQVEVPAAPPGARVRYAGHEAPLEAGQARFALTADSLHVGDNRIVVDVVEPTGDVTQVPVTLTLQYRVYPELALEADPPTLFVVVEAEPGARVTLEGEPVALDARGRARRRFLLEADAAEGPQPVLERTVRYDITPPGGEPDQGQVRARIPYTTLQIDRPGAEAVTDAESIEIAGAVHPSASVAIDGEEVSVEDGRFLHRRPLPETRTYSLEVRASQPGRVPRSRTLEVRRVEDLGAEADSFRADSAVTYARLEQNPNIYRGRKVSFTGRVYNVQVSQGQGVLQMLVRNCPRDRRCPLWVTYPAATEVSVNEWVQVLGEVTGEQQFKAKSDRVITVPRVDATYVLSARK